MIKGRKFKKLNNDGAALVITVVVITFVSILTTMILYYATMSYHRKATDYQTKVSFYGAEIPLEELRMQLTIDLSNAAVTAYEKVMTNYASLTGGTEPGGIRQTEFRAELFDAIEAVWATRTISPTDPSVTNDWRAGIDSVVPLTTANNNDYHVVDVQCTEATCTASYHVILEDLGGAARFERDDAAGRMTLKGLKVIYTADNGFTSIITTDLVIVAPTIDWGVEATAETWNDTSSTYWREELDFGEFVSYINWKKQ